MSLSNKQIAELLRQVSLTRDHEINCEQCLSLTAEFAEHQLVGRSIVKALKAVEHHLSICAECSEEYEALQQALKAMQD